MLGAAVAFRRAEHMRMTALVNKASPTTKAFLEVFAVSVSLIFVLLVLLPSFQATIQQAVIRTPALGISRAWRTAALPVGLRSEEHTSELQSLMRTSHHVFCWKKKNQNRKTKRTN